MTSGSSTDGGRVMFEGVPAELTGSGAAVGFVILCFDLPGVVTGAILGRLLDRYQPRLVMGFDTSPERYSSQQFLRSTPYTNGRSASNGDK